MTKDELYEFAKFKKYKKGWVDIQLQLQQKYKR
jgi:hypothetical protein